MNMDYLTSHDMRRLFECLLDLYELRDSNSFKQQAVKGLATLVSADLYSYNEISTSQQLVTAMRFGRSRFLYCRAPRRFLAATSINTRPSCIT
jgi:hypothetical protein